MKLFRELISFEKALEIILNSVKKIEEVETIPIETSVGRVLAEDVIAEINIPPFSRAAEDGYAVVAEDTYNASINSPVKLKVIGRIDVGEKPSCNIYSGVCVEIATGAPIPPGANAVIRFEETERVGDTVLINSPVYPGRSIAPEGEDIKIGERILLNGQILTPPRVGVLASLGRRFVRVYRRPKVAIISTGNEIVRPGELLPYGKVYDVNSYTLGALVAESGGLPVIFEIIEDDVEKMRSTLKVALECDFIVFSGASSVGTRDILIEVISEVGEIKFHGVQIKPGKPCWFAIVENKPVLGLPGFPTSCLSNAYLFLKPAIEKMSNRKIREPKKIRAILGKRISATLGRTTFLTVKIEKEDGKIVAYPTFKTSGAITSLANADGYIVIPPNVDVLEKNEEVDVFLIED